MNELSVMQLLSHLASPLVIAGLALLLHRTRSPWLVAALVFESASLLFRIGVYVSANRLLDSSLYMAAWQLSALLFAVCFLGFAVTYRR